MAKVKVLRLIYCWNLSSNAWTCSLNFIISLSKQKCKQDANDVRNWLQYIIRDVIWRYITKFRYAGKIWKKLLAMAFYRKYFCCVFVDFCMIHFFTDKLADFFLKLCKLVLHIFTTRKKPTFKHDYAKNRSNKKMGESTSLIWTH